MKRFRTLPLFILLALTLFGASPMAIADSAAAAGSTETIVLIRHGEKPKHEIGQLSIMGLNRALALPAILIGKYGKPNYIFAPNPSQQITGWDDPNPYSYIRPLATIEPTAIKLDLPVNTQIGYQDIAQLQSELTKPMYANSVIFVAWEHVYLDLFTKNVVKAYGVDDSTVPDWPGSDYDSIFVIRLTHSEDTTTATFTVDHEGLNGKLSNDYPAVSGG